MGQSTIFLIIIVVTVIGVIIAGIAVGAKRPQRRLPNLTPPEKGREAGQLAVRLGCSLDALAAVAIAYQQFVIPKRSGGQRVIHAPEPSLKKVQRTILNRLLSKLKSHPAATGFERGASIVTNAFGHVGADVVLRMDIKNFFTATGEGRLRGYLYGIGWDKKSADILVRLCTYKGSLPQGAPTSPRLSNLINYELDARLDGWARKVGAIYTRYADDITFSFHDMDNRSSVQIAVQNPKTLEKVPYALKPDHFVAYTIRMTKKVLAEYGYELHTKRKLNIRRRHQQQKVTGLVVNKTVALPRKTRRRLRAVQHHLETGRPASLTQKQFAGWQAFRQMIKEQYDSLANG